MASGRCSGGGSWSEQLMGCLGGGGDDDDAAGNAPTEVREVALEPASPTPAGETYEQHLARARSPRRPPPQNAAGDDDSGDEIIQAAAARWPPPPRPAATSGDASRPPPPAATVCKPCAPDGASEDPRRHHATGGRAYEI